MCVCICVYIYIYKVRESTRVVLGDIQKQGCGVLLTRLAVSGQSPPLNYPPFNTDLCRLPTGARRRRPGAGGARLLYSTLLYSTIPYHTILHYPALHYTTLHYTIRPLRSHSGALGVGRARGPRGGTACLTDRIWHLMVQQVVQKGLACSRGTARLTLPV